jgi:uncharacterized protein YdeI (YjbR/CyaY-like superfamily)
MAISPRQSSRNSRVDAYIERAPGFARPVLSHLRGLVHDVCPDCTEAIKWSRPCFLYGGTILCNMSAFTSHCSFGFWGAEMGAVLARDGIESEGSSGSFGRLTGVADLPSDRALRGYLKTAKRFVDSARRTATSERIAKPSPKVKPRRAAAHAPPGLTAALADDAKAAAAFAALSPSHRREYIEWIVEAKRDATKAARIAKTVAQLGDGKSLHWKYQRPT